MLEHFHNALTRHGQTKAEVSSHKLYAKAMSKIHCWKPFWKAWGKQLKSTAA